MANTEHKTVKTTEVWFQEIESTQREIVQHSYPFQLLLQVEEKPLLGTF